MRNEELGVECSTVNGQRSTVKVSGPVADIVVTDTLGNTLLRTDQSTFSLAAGATRVLLLRITTTDGKTIVKKVRI